MEVLAMITEESVSRSLEGPLYSPSQVGVATFIGGLLAGALLLRGNYRALNDSGGGTRAVLYSLAAIALVWVAVEFLPANFPSSLIPAVYAGAMHQVAVRLHGGAYAAHVGAGGPKQAWWHAIALGILGLLITLVIAVVVFGAWMILEYGEFVV
jgi:hypothetical protein